MGQWRVHLFTNMPVSAFMRPIRESLHGSATGNEIHQNHDDSHDQEDMNKCSQRISGDQPKQPMTISITAIVYNIFLEAG